MADKEFKIVINTNTGDVKQAMAQVATAIEAVGGKIDEVNNNSGFDNVIKKLDKVSSSMTSMGKSMTAKVTLPLMGIGTMAVKTFSDFEYGMKKVQAVTGASSNELAKMTEMARDLGANTEYSATQAAEGMFNLSTAGFTVEETMQAIPGLLDMATAAQTDLGTATEIAAGTLRGFGMGAGDITQVADVLAYTANNTNASITDLGLGMSYVAPIAKTAGISLEETSAILGKLSDANLKGEKAGTALRGMMARLLDPSKEAVGTLKSLGLSANDVNPSMHSMAEVIGTLGSKGLTTAQIMKIFGQEAGPGAAVLLAQGEDGIKKLTAELNNAGGASKQTAEVMRQTFAAQWDDFMGKMEDAAITLGSVIVPMLTPVMEKIGNLATKFKELNPATQKVVVVLGILATAIGPLLLVLGSMAGAIGNVINVIKNWGTIVKGFQLVLGALTSPIGITVLAIGALITVGVLLYKNWDKIIAKLIWLWDKFKDGVTTRIAKLKQIYGGILLPFPELIAKMKKVGTDLIQGLINGIKSMVKKAVASIRNLGNSIVTGLKGILGIHSPSTVMQEVGKNITAGLSIGMEQGADDVIEQTKDLGESISETLLNASEKLNNEILRLEAELTEKKAKQEEQRAKDEIVNADKEVKASKDKIAQYDEELKKVDGNAKKEKEVREKLKEESEKLAEAQKKAAELRQTSEDTATQNIINDLKEQQTMIDKVKSLWDTYNNTLVSSREEYFSKVEQLNSQLISEEKNLTQKYEQELESRTNSIANFTGLFESVQVKNVSGQDLLANLEGQVEALQNWRDNLNELSSRGVDVDLMSSLREMGAGSASEIQALTELSDEELDKYVQLWQEKNAEAKEEATLQLKELKSETQKGISELRNNASEQLTLYENEWKTKNETIKNDTITQLQAMVNQAQIQGNAFVVTLATAIQQAMPELYDALSGIPGVGAITGQKGENSQVGEAEAQRDGVVSATNQQNTAVINSTAIATQTVLKTWQDAGAVMNETHNVIREQTLTIWNDIYAKITTLWAKFLADTKKTWTEQQVFILEVLTTIQNKFNELVLKSETWGVSLMSGFIKGIKSKKQDLIETLEEMTATVDQYMPQSPAEKGALSKLDKYGPAFVNTFAEGITSSIPVLEKAMSALTMSAVPVMSSGAGNTTTTTSTSTANSFTITLNGKDDEALLSNLMRELHKRGVKF